MDNPNEVLIVIPAHNEASNIGRVISEVKEKAPFADILVVNDGSDDFTEEIVRKHQVKLINIPFRLGIGGAMQTGFIFAYANNYDIAVQLDGDGQHNPVDIKELLQPIINQQADMVIGSRFLTKESYHSDFSHRLGMGVLSKLIFFISGQKFTDPTSGFRASNKAAMAFYNEYYPIDYPEAEVIMLLLKRGFKIKEIAVTMRARLSGKSSIRRLHSIYYMVKVIMAILVTSLEKRKYRKE